MIDDSQKLFSGCVAIVPGYAIDRIDNRWQSISINTNQYQSIDWNW